MKLHVTQWLGETVEFITIKEEATLEDVVGWCLQKLEVRGVSGADAYHRTPVNGELDGTPHIIVGTKDDSGNVTYPHYTINIE
jgi:hypothetical protein